MITADAITVDGEPFVPEVGGALAYGPGNESREISDDGREVTVTARDDDGTLVTATYVLSEVVAEVAHYDHSNPDFTTEPAETERVHAYIAVNDDDASPDALTLDGETFDADAGHPRELWDRSPCVEFQEDYVVATGLDDTDPVPNQYDVYWILVEAETDDGDVAYRHANYDPNE